MDEKSKLATNKLNSMKNGYKKPNSLPTLHG